MKAMNQLHFFPVRPATAMCRAQRGAICARLLNILNAFNTFLNAFPEPNRARRMRIPTRFYGVLLAGLFGWSWQVVPAAAAVITMAPHPPPKKIFGLFPISRLWSGRIIFFVGWTNPDQINITGV